MLHFLILIDEVTSNPDISHKSVNGRDKQRSRKKTRKNYLKSEGRKEDEY
jgi:hypothetical protein